MSNDPPKLPITLAFLVLPIAQQYGMHKVLQLCIRAVEQQASLPLEQDQKTSNSDSSGSDQDPTLFEWLALADARQCTPLINIVLSHLAKAILGLEDQV
jgi:hypothetical protein